TDIPLDSLHGRKDDAGRSMRLALAPELPPASMGEFSLSPTQGPVRAAFVPLARLERDLALPGRANTLLVAGTDTHAGTLAVRNALAEALTLDDLGLTISADYAPRTLIVQSGGGLIAEPLAGVVSRLGADRDLQVTPVLSWLATVMRVGD